MPLLVATGIRLAALELAHVGLPFGLSWQSYQSCHVALPVEIVYRVANHEEVSTFAVNLHIKYAHLTLTFDDFGPDVGMGFHVFLYHFLVVNEGKGLAIAFHISHL